VTAEHQISADSAWRSPGVKGNAVDELGPSDVIHEGEVFMFFAVHFVELFAKHLFILREESVPLNITIYERKV
jgi:hypothetical protein